MPDVTFDDLDDGLDDGLAKKVTLEESGSERICKSAHVANGGEALHSCLKCGGSGLYRGGWSARRPMKCFACGGSGRVTAAKAAAAKGAVTKLRNWSEWCEEHATLIEGLRRHEWNSFLSGLHAQIFEAQRQLSDRQVEAAYSAIARYDAKREEKRAAEAASRTTEIGLEAIERLFATATASGLKRPMFRAERVSVKQSRHPGVLYVYDREVGGERGGYAGKIVEGRFVRHRDADASLGEALQAVAADPVAAAKSYGLSTGHCCMCGRELTDPVSVANGIGPDCASNWGL